MDKFKSLESISQEDLNLINKYSIKELTADDVYAFAVVLCDNEVDRDLERFSISALKELAKLFPGRPGGNDHSWKASEICARTYKTELLENKNKKTRAGEIYTYLKAYAYVLRTDDNKQLIADLEGGIRKEVSIGVSCTKRICSICGAAGYCPEHSPGQMYNGKLCHRILDDAKDAYEWSFVAVPAQPAAGVTKSYIAMSVDEAFNTLESSDLAGCTDRIKALFTRAAQPTESDLRAAIIAENKKYL